MRPDGQRSGVVAFAIAFPVAVVFAFLVVIPTLSEAEGERTCFLPFFVQKDGLAD